MKSSNRKVILLTAILFVLSGLVYIRLAPLREFHYYPPYEGPLPPKQHHAQADTSKKTVIIMADNTMTELFDLLAPYYLFSETGKANVYVIAPVDMPVVTENGPFIQPHFSYAAFDSLKMKADVIVIPYMNDPESPEKINWLRNHYSDKVTVLSICDGAWTAAASGIFDYIPITSHATGRDRFWFRFPKPKWVSNTSYTQHENRFSTGGVSNAADGTLAVIEYLFGKETQADILKRMTFRSHILSNTHESVPLSVRATVPALFKILFGNNKELGVVIPPGVNEFELGAVFDIYARTMPASLKAMMPSGSPVLSEHGLVIMSTDIIREETLDEIHVLGPISEPERMLVKYEHAKVIDYGVIQESYVVDKCLSDIRKEYGAGFENFVKLTLDYN